MTAVTTSDGRTLTYEELGTGAPLVCIPGGPGFTAAQLGDIGGLARHRKLLVVNTRGVSGSTAPPDGSYSLDDHSNDLEELRAHLGLEKMTLFGHSHGALIAIWYASEHPDRVERVILDGLPLPDSPVPEKIEEMFARWDAETEALVEQATAGRHEPSAEYFFEKEWPDVDVASRMESILAGTLVIMGEKDPVSIPIADAAATTLRSAQLVKVPDAGHFAWVENPDYYRTAIIDFLNAEVSEAR